MNKKEYYILLKHPKWKAKRKRVLKRDKNCCSLCGRTKFLQIHHLYYIFDKKPWEYPLYALKTLCRYCHTKIHRNTKIPWFKSHREAKKKLGL